VAKRSRERAARAIDRAMQANRPEKAAVRAFWIETLKSYNRRYPDPTELLYVTLPGAEGTEIALLAENDLIQLTEIGGIAQDSMARIAAVESNKLAIGSLQRKFPGLKIYETDFKGLLRGDGLLRYPEGEHEDCCRARVINLDLNELLVWRDNSFPILSWIQKLGLIHATAPRVDWCLYLTLHGEVRMSQDASAEIIEFLRENFARAHQFAESSRALLGGELFETISNDSQVALSELDREAQQKILMLFVPKKMADLMRPQLWRLTTTRNLRYGRPGHAPMVTWIVEFEFDRRAAATPDAVYVQNVNGVLASAGRIDGAGKLVSD